MRILLVAPMFPPQRGVASLRTHSFAATWAAAGHDVTVLTTRKQQDQVGLSLPASGFAVHEVPYPVPWPLARLRLDGRASLAGSISERSSILLAPLRWLKARTGVFSAVRQPDLTDAWARPALAWALAQESWDTVVSSFGPPAAHLVALALKSRGRCRVWAADFRDLWSDNHMYAGLFPFTLAERRRERRVLAAADRLVTVSPGLARRLAMKAGRPVDVIYNGYDPAAFAQLEPTPAFPADGRVRLVYTGTVYDRGQDVHPLCAAVAAEPRAVLVIATDRPGPWLAAARRYGLGDRLDLRGPVAWAEALRLQRDATALVLLDWRDPRAGVLTGKVFEYLMSPAPIWVIGGGAHSPAAELVATADRGLALGRDVDCIRMAIRESDGWSAEPNRDFIAGLTRERQALRFLGLLEQDRQDVTSA
jgi:glycosyltransferase involved in cell wall biosynthesis